MNQMIGTGVLIAVIVLVAGCADWGARRQQEVKATVIPIEYQQNPCWRPEGSPPLEDCYYEDGDVTRPIEGAPWWAQPDQEPLRLVVTESPASSGFHYCGALTKKGTPCKHRVTDKLMPGQMVPFENCRQHAITDSDCEWYERKPNSRLSH